MSTFVRAVILEFELSYTNHIRTQITWREMIVRSSYATELEYSTVFNSEGVVTCCLKMLEWGGGERARS